MSGGHFNDNGYVYHDVDYFAYELEIKIENNNQPDEYGWAPNYPDEVLEYLKKQVAAIRKTASIMRHIDYLYSGDHGSDNFMERVKEVESKYGS